MLQTGRSGGPVDLLTSDPGLGDLDLVDPLRTWVGSEVGRPAFTWYVVVLLIVSAVVVARLPETRGKALS